jgi:hypothetical protein
LYSGKKNAMAVFKNFIIVAISKNSKSPNQLVLLKKKSFRMSKFADD